MDNGLSTNHSVAVGYITNKESGEFLSLMKEHSLVTKGGADFLAQHAHHESFEYPSGSCKGDLI